MKLIELRVRETDDELDDKRRKTGYKVVALSGAYGTAAETNPIDIDPDDVKRKLRAVMVYADKAFKDWVGRPERPGRFNFFPTAALITAEGRLLLAMAKHEVERRGGAVATATPTVSPSSQRSPAASSLAWRSVRLQPWNTGYPCALLG